MALRVTDREYTLKQVEEARRMARSGMQYAASQLASLAREARDSIVSRGTPGNLREIKIHLRNLEAWSHEEAIWTRVEGLLRREERND